MDFFKLTLLAVGLSMDAFAVAVCKGLAMCRLSVKKAAIVGLWFGGFQAMMPLIGYFLGVQFSEYIIAVDHWIAFLLLLYLGGKMVYESFQEKEDNQKINPLCYKTLCGLGIATSIDALAVGVSLACLNSAIAIETLTIGIVTFIFSAFGVYFGNHFKRKINLKIDLIGGLILITIGTKILIEHIFFNG